jgi:hypothetical protein
MILKEVLAFMSYIEANTTLYQRLTEIYINSPKFFIKWEEESNIY